MHGSIDYNTRFDAAAAAHHAAYVDAIDAAIAAKEAADYANMLDEESLRQASVARRAHQLAKEAIYAAEDAADRASDLARAFDVAENAMRIAAEERAAHIAKARVERDNELNALLGC